MSASALRWPASSFSRSSFLHLLPSSSSSAVSPVGRRHESSLRRTSKKLRVKPAPSSLPSTNATQQDHIVFNPPSSAPPVYHTPLKFLPKDDRRRQLFAELPENQPPSAGSHLPPPVRKPYQKQYHLTENEIAEIRRLRQEDPVQWSRERLAKKFNCSPLFVVIVCEASREHRDRQKQALEAVKSRWGRRRREAREDRVRRRETWGMDESAQ